MKKNDKAVARLKQGSERTPGGWVWVPDGAMRLKEPIFVEARRTGIIPRVTENTDEELSSLLRGDGSGKEFKPCGSTRAYLKYFRKCESTKDPLEKGLASLPNELLLKIRLEVGDVIYDHSRTIVRGKGVGGIRPRQLSG
jgi:hypothetical protein